MRKITFLLGILLLGQMCLNAQTKRVLIEEGTGTWCNWCPRGIVFGEQMVYEYDVIFIAIHMNDIMESTPEYADATTIQGLPAGNIDRTAMRIDPLNWESRVLDQLNEVPPADISVTTTYNPATRNISMTVTADFFVALNGDYRLGAVVVEDAVTGTSTGYDQYNAYSGGSTQMGGWENLPNPVPARQMFYDHVSRYLATEYKGDPGSLPGSISAGSQHSYTLNYTLPPEYDDEYVHVVGYITNADTGKILNAGKSPYLFGNTNAQPMFVSQARTNALVGVIYQYDILVHDPDNLDLTISGVDIPSWMTLTTTGPRTASLLGTPLVEGTYPVILSVSDGNSTRQQEFQVIVTNSGGVDWQVVGSEGFTGGSASSVNLKVSSLGVPYVMSASSNNQISVHRFENAIWSLVGNTINGDETQAAMAMGPDNTPYVFTRDGTLKVFKFDGSTWIQVGGSIGDGYHIDMVIANDGTPYVSYMDVAAEAKGICKKWDGSNWITVGGTHFTSQVAVWTKVTTNNNNQPLVLYGTGSSGNGPFFSTVSAYNGSAWEVLGGGNIDSSNATYFSHSFAMDINGKIYVGLTASSTMHQLNVYDWNGTAWSKIGDNISGGDTYDVSLALDLQGKPVIGFRDETESGKTTVMRIDNGNWYLVGLAGFSNIASYQSLAYSPEGEPFIAYQDAGNNNKGTVKRYGLILSTTDFSKTISNIRVFPNPNTGAFTVLSHYEGRFQLIDLQGRVISEGILKPKATENGKYAYSFNYASLSKGLYLFHIMGEGKREVVKILIE